MTTAPRDDGLFRAIFEGTPDALLLSDDEGRYVDANGAASELFGCPAEDLLGRSIADFLPADADFESAWEAFRQDGQARGTLEIQRPDGDRRTVEFAASADILAGTHLFAIRDISEREGGRVELHRQTEMLTKVFETSPVGIVVVDADGAIVESNERAESVLGLGRQKLRGRTYDDHRWRAIREDGTPMPTEELPVARVFATGDAVYNVEHGIEQPDGETVWLSVNAAPIYGDDGVDRVVVVVSDVTSRREYLRMLEQQNERLEEYSATVSHDLRNPLSVASGWLDVAIEENGPTEPLEKLNDALDRMSDLIADLRELGRYGQTVEGMVEVELEELAHDAWSNVDTPDATLLIEEDLGPVDGEHGRLLQLFENLFRNAVEHGWAGVTARIGTLDHGFFIEDDGPGIPERSRDSVFDFGCSTTEGGTGIGLAIVKAVADAHGWDLELTDAESGGARFEFRPRWHPDRDDRAVGSEAE